MNLPALAPAHVTDAVACYGCGRSEQDCATAGGCRYTTEIDEFRNEIHRLRSIIARLCPAAAAKLPPAPPIPGQRALFDITEVAV